MNTLTSTTATIAKEAAATTEESGYEEHYSSLQNEVEEQMRDILEK